MQAIPAAQWIVSPKLGLSDANTVHSDISSLFCFGPGEIETALDEFETQLRGAPIVLRSKTPALVEQEFRGLLPAHLALRGLMHEAALKADIDPDRLWFLHSVRVVRRRLARRAAIVPSAWKAAA